MQTNTNIFKRIIRERVLCAGFIVLAIWGIYSLTFTTNKNYNKNIAFIIFFAIFVVALVLFIIAIILPDDFKYRVYIIEDYLYIEEMSNNESEEFKISKLKLKMRGKRIDLNDGNHKQSYYWNTKFLIFLNSVIKNENTVDQNEHIP